VCGDADRIVLGNFGRKKAAINPARMPAAVSLGVRARMSRKIFWRVARSAMWMPISLERWVTR
jgi:hypothetical protein